MSETGSFAGRRALLAYSAYLGRGQIAHRPSLARDGT
jgi:hypothetical protein